MNRKPLTCVPLERKRALLQGHAGQRRFGTVHSGHSGIDSGPLTSRGTLLAQDHELLISEGVCLKIMSTLGAHQGHAGQRRGTLGAHLASEQSSWRPTGRRAPVPLRTESGVQGRSWTVGRWKSGHRKQDHFEPSIGKVLHMTNDETQGYRLGPDARVVLHRHGARGSYAVAVVIDEGPYSLSDARMAAAFIREENAGWVPKAVAAERLGVTARQVDYLREQGRLVSSNDETGHALISSESLAAEVLRREADGS